MREDVVPAVVNVSFTINTSVVSKLLVNELVSIGAVATFVAVVVVVAVVIFVVDGVSNISVVIISVISLGKLLVAFDIGSVLVLVTTVTGCKDRELVCTDDNSDDGSSMKR